MAAAQEIAAARPRQLVIDCYGRCSETVVEKLTSQHRICHGCPENQEARWFGG
jgi:hypothetical protein